MLYNIRMEEKTVRPISSFHGGATFSLSVIIYLIMSLVASFIALALPKESDGVKYLMLLVSPVAIAAVAAIFFRYTKAPLL